MSKVLGVVVLLSVRESDRYLLTRMVDGRIEASDLVELFDMLEYGE